MREEGIHLDTDKIEEVISPGGSAEGKIRISASQGKRVRGFVYSDHGRIVTDLKEFTGREIVLRYGIDGTGLAEGDEICGKITLATDAGEYSIPVEAYIRQSLPDTSRGTIRNLRDFSELAYRNYEEAFRLFKNPVFPEILTDEDEKIRTLCRGLREDPVTKRKMEEFLILSGCKKPVELKLIGSGAEYHDIRESTQYTATLRRNRWGYISLDLSTEDRFLELPVTHFTEEDFVGSVCDIPFIIHGERLGRGSRTGKIRIRGGREDLVLEVTASGAENKSEEREIQIQHHVDRILRLLLEERLKSMDCAAKEKNADRYLRQSAERGRMRELLEEILPELTAVRELGGDRLYAALLECWIRLRAGQTKESIGLLYPLREYDLSSDSPEIQGIYLYLCTETGLYPIEKSRREDKIHELALRRPDSFLLMKLTCLTDPEMARTPIAGLRLMQKTYSEGCRSPFLYAEALELLLKDDSLLTTVNGFFRQVLAFAVKENRFTEDLALRTAYLSDNEKRYRPITLKILAGMYRKYPQNAILEAICRTLIKGPSRDSRCFSWYALAVDANLRITRLYEYYIETIPESWQKILPAVIRKYFLYNDTISEQNRAWLYANIVRNRVEDPDTFEDYREKIADFADKSLKSGRMNADYAALYQVFFRNVKDEDEADALADLIFTEQVFCDAKNIRRVVAVHGELSKEEVVPLVRGRAYIHSYTDETEIFFEDVEGDRFRSDMDYSVERLMDPRTYASVCLEKGSRKSGLILYTLHREGSVSADTLELWQNVTDNSDFSEEFRSLAAGNLLQYDLKHTDDYSLRKSVEKLAGCEYSYRHQALLTEVLLSFGFYERAFQLVLKYGSEGVEDSLLVRLCDRMIEEKHSEGDDELTALCMSVWKRRKFDERILSYLTKYWNGSMEDMLLLRKDAEDFFVETFPLDQRILVRIMFSHLNVSSGPKLLRNYIEKGGQWRLARTYIAYASGYAFDGTEKIDPYLGLCLREMYGRDEMNLLMKLTLLRFYSEKGKLDAAEEEQVDALLKEAEENGIILKFFQNLPRSFVREYQLEDKVFIEWHAEPDDQVILHYRLDSIGMNGEKNKAGEVRPQERNQAGSTKEETYRTEPLGNVYRGIFQKVFTLFYGERLTYRITVIHEGTEITSSDKTVTGPAADVSGRSRFQRINRMLKMMHDGKTEELQDEIRDYKKDSAMMENLFSLREEIK